jgi:hypothetical protein
MDRSLLRPKDTRERGETSSHHVVIEVVIYDPELVGENLYRTNVVARVIFPKQSPLAACQNVPKVEWSQFRLLSNPSGRLLQQKLNAPK